MLNFKINLTWEKRMGLFSGVKAQDAEDIIFKAGERVKFLINDATENLDPGYLKLEMTVKSGEYEGRDYIHYLKKSNKASDLQNLARFALAFWSEEQLENDECQIGDLV